MSLAAGSFLAGRWLIQRGRVAKGGEVRDAAEPARTRESVADGSPRSPRSPSDGRELFLEFPCALGDVILRTGGDEAWLAGALVFAEEAPVAALFVAPDAGGDIAVLVRPRPRVSLTWLRALSPSDANALALGPEPPSAIEHEGLWFQRTSRLPVHAQRVGTGAPDVGEHVIVAEYASSGEKRVLIVSGVGVLRAFHGVILDAALYEIIASGSSTLNLKDENAL
jgi:hypothetical protein